MQTLISAVIFLIVFGSVLFLAYVTTKFIGTRTNRIMKGRHVSIVETVSLGFDSKLHLIKVGEEFVLVSTSGKNTQLLTKVQLDDYSMEEAKTSNNFNFKDIFDKYIYSFKDKQGSKSFLNAKNSEQTSNKESQVFSRNLNKLRSITTGFGMHKTEDGDEYTNEN